MIKYKLIYRCSHLPQFQFIQMWHDSSLPKTWGNIYYYLSGDISRALSATRADKSQAWTEGCSLSSFEEALSVQRKECGFHGSIPWLAPCTPFISAPEHGGISEADFHCRGKGEIDKNSSPLFPISRISSINERTQNVHKDELCVPIDRQFSTQSCFGDSPNGHGLTPDPCFASQFETSHGASPLKATRPLKSQSTAWPVAEATWEKQ